jgi:hypothetical protein
VRVSDDLCIACAIWPSFLLKRPKPIVLEAAKMNSSLILHAPI